MAASDLRQMPRVGQVVTFFVDGQEIQTSVVTRIRNLNSRLETVDYWFELASSPGIERKLNYDPDQGKWQYWRKEEYGEPRLVYLEDVTIE